MKHIKIHNVGPLRDIDIELSRVNIFTGPQGSGKSTLSKIIAYCMWVEKSFCLLRRAEEDVYGNVLQKEIESYYGFYDYFSEDSLILYKSDFVELCIGRGADAIMFTGADMKEYRRPKILYIPAERCIVASLPNWHEMKMSDGYLRQYLMEWGHTRRLYSAASPFNLDILNISYSYDEKTREDKVKLSNGMTVSISTISSGMQSVLPMLLPLTAYKEKRNELNSERSVADEISLSNLYDRFLSPSPAAPKPYQPQELETFTYKGKQYWAYKGKTDETINVLNHFSETQYVQALIEEPESNLFPQTQIELLYQILKDVNDTDNEIVITTHSPYILFAANNCMMGAIVERNIPKENLRFFPSRDSWISPEKVSVYEIHDGQLRCIQDEDGTLNDNYLNEAYRSVSNEFSNMLNYYGDDN